MIDYKGEKYPELQLTGNAMRFAIPFFREIIGDRAKGYDIGCNRLEWCYPGAQPIDPALSGRSAMNLPYDKIDFIASSHCLEHVPEHIGTVLEYWLSRLNDNGVICLYLPNCDYQKYWAFGNKKHIHYLNPAIMKGFCHELECSEYIVTEGWDLNGSFTVLIIK